MPYESSTQRRFFKGCKHSPRHMRGKCPSEKAIGEFESAERRMKAKRVMRGKR